MTRMRFRDLPAAAVAKLPNPLEEDWTGWVIARAEEHDWMAVHFRKAASAKGFRTPVQGRKGSPDLLLARHGDVLLPELKRNNTYLDPDQKQWAHHLGPYTAVWRPRDALHVLTRLKGSPDELPAP